MAFMSKKLVFLLLILMALPHTRLWATNTDVDDSWEIDSTECVILLHGLGRNKHCMKKIAERLEGHGYQVWNEGYPSTKKSIRSLVTDHLQPAVEWAKEMGAVKIHFVTHSLGGILTRFYLQENAIPKGSRIVMISPPNKGSEVADRLKSLFLYKRWMGPAGQEIGTSFGSVPNKLKPVDADIGVISGTRSMEPWFSIMIPGPDDGKVSVENTKLSEMNDFLTVKSTHPFIMTNFEVINQVAFYLRNGRFDR